MKKGINKTAQFFNSIKIFLFKLFLKEAEVTATSMFELKSFHVFRPGNYIPFCPLGIIQNAISSAIWDLGL